MMKTVKDNRITERYTSFKEYAVLLLVLAGFNGFHMWIYQAMYQSGLLRENTMTVINILGLYVMVMAAIAVAIIGLIRYHFFINPMIRLGKAAREIAKGDFSIRVPALRRSKRKSFIDVLFEDFNSMAAELASIETLKNDFIANVSHELKTPLSVIQTYSKALQDETMPQEQRREYTQTIIDAAQKLSILITNILKLNKLENQGIVGEAKPFNLSEQIRRCVLMFADQMEQKRICFEENMDEISVCYNENLLEIVWNNLISNAVKFSNPGGVLFIGLKEIREANKKYIRVSITDNGCGMDVNVQKRIFDRFFQGDTSHSGTGNGLGLALVKKTVDLLGGTIMVESKPGQGSTFTINLKNII